MLSDTAAPCLTEGMLSDRFSKNKGYSSSMLELKKKKKKEKKEKVVSGKAF